MDWPDFYSTYPAWLDGNTRPGYDNYGTGLRLAAGDRSYVLGPAQSRGNAMPSLADMLMPPPGGTPADPMTRQDAMQQMLRGGPNASREDVMRTLQTYPHGRIPEEQQPAMMKRRKFASMFQFLSKAPARAASPDQKVYQLADVMKQAGMQPPTIGELIGDGGGQFSSTDLQQQLPYEEWAAALLKDKTGEFFKDALERIQ